MPRSRLAAPVLAAGLALALAVAATGCGSARTETPSEVVPAPPLEAVAPASTEAPAGTPETEAAPVTASAFKSPGEKHPLPGGTVAASYPRVGVRPPKGATPAPPGQVWAVVNVRFCAAPEGSIAAALVDPGRFRVEVPGQGEVAPAPGAPALAKAPLTAGTADVAAGRCLEGSIAYLVAGEGHIEAVTYDSGAGVLRWAT